MLRLPLFGRKKLLLAFEYGVIMAETAVAQKVPLTPQLIEKAERMIEGEFRIQTPTRLAVDIVPNVLTAFELDLSQ